MTCRKPMETLMSISLPPVQPLKDASLQQNSFRIWKMQAFNISNIDLRGVVSKCGKYPCSINIPTTIQSCFFQTAFRWAPRCETPLRDHRRSYGQIIGLRRRSRPSFRRYGGWLRNPNHQLKTVVSTSHDLKGFNLRWCRISQPSTVCCGCPFLDSSWIMTHRCQNFIHYSCCQWTNGTHFILIGTMKVHKGKEKQTDPSA